MAVNAKRLYPIAAILATVSAIVVAGCVATSTSARYPQQYCTSYAHAKKEFEAGVMWCVRYVEVRSDVMEVGVSWQVVTLRGRVATIYQTTDENNPTMYLVDEFGNRYDHMLVSGAAKGAAHSLGSLQTGSFFFPPPKNGARKFRFHDDDNRAVLDIRF